MTALCRFVFEHHGGISAAVRGIETQPSGAIRRKQNRLQYAIHLFLRNF